MRLKAVMNFLICGCDPRWGRDALVAFLRPETATRASAAPAIKVGKVHDSF
jgi:hypothetical protein